MIATYSDPIPGWVNNVSGLNGIVVGIGSGFIRGLAGHPDLTGDAVCADFVTNATFAASYDLSVQK